VRASSLSHSGLHHHAIAAATHALKFGIQVHGATSIDLVPMILLLGSANIGINKLNKAETYLSQANYLVSMVSRRGCAARGPSRLPPPATAFVCARVWVWVCVRLFPASLPASGALGACAGGA